MTRLNLRAFHSKLETNESVTNIQIRNEQEVWVHYTIARSIQSIISTQQRKKNKTALLNLHSKFAFLKLSLQITSRTISKSTPRLVSRVASQAYFRARTPSKHN